MYHAMGVNELNIYVINVITELYNVLKLYEKEISLNLHPGTLLPKISGYDANGYTEAMNQLICYNECYLDHRESAEFILFSDLDEVITSVNGNLLKTVRILFNQIPSVAGFGFTWKTSSYIKVDTVNEYSVGRMFNGLRVWRNESYVKSIIVPKRVGFSIVHDVEGMIYQGREVKHVKLPLEEGYTVHLRAEAQMTKHKGIDLIDANILAETQINEYRKLNNKKETVHAVTF
ncbi:unnamed protein product [Bursaphelenchus okinawaensis]|uniref:Glycosyltransferase family 92 protein n=1 Tax=Bursaphelenchus okinawaensis TaxID=465554 RepID=A0A811KD62_9BILA|nr:unnamed protein product [Bursaphelenchus okinawaensis]CAG9101361.1 unnamed protein product [Bursaphelenchus okinawaensis]